MLARSRVVSRGAWWLGVPVGAAGVVWARTEEQNVLQPPEKPGIYQKAKFDPRAIEEVATMVKEKAAAMERLKKTALEKQAEERERASQYKEAARQMANNFRDGKRRSDQATRDARANHERARSQYKAMLHKEREEAARGLDQALRDGEEERVAQHEKRLEDIRRETADYEAELKRSIDAAYVRAKALESASAERQTHDLKLAMLRERGTAARAAAVEAVTAACSSVGAGCRALLGDEQRMFALVAVVAGGTFGVAASRQITRVAGTYVEARIKTPALVRETSRGYGLAAGTLPVPAFVANLVSRVDGALAGSRGATSKVDVTPFAATEGKKAPFAPYEKTDPFARAVFEGAAFPPEVEAQLLRVAVGAANTRRHRAPFRHALLHGPPGTGKTMFAKKLARCSGMDYAIVSGGDVAPLGRDAVTSLHKLFDWAHTSPRGLLLLIDEAEAFVRSRSLAGNTMSEDARNALNAFLYRTGSETSDVLVVFASNAPELFDKAVLDRIDDVVKFTLPAKTERLAILHYELSQYLAADPVLEALDEQLQGDTPPTKKQTTKHHNIILDGVTVDDFHKAAERIDGFSGRECAKLAIAWRAAAYAADTDGNHPKLTPQILHDVTTSQLAQTKIKRQWRDAARKATLEA